MAIKSLNNMVADRQQSGTNEGFPEKVPLWKINILPQMRTVFDEGKIAELAKDVAVNGIQQNPGVAKLTTEQCRDYLEVYNKVKRKEVTIDQLQSVVTNGRRYYYILIFGERRIRSLRLIWTIGDPNADVINKRQRRGYWYIRRFGADLVDVNVYDGIEAFKALERQFSENCYEPPGPVADAVAITELFVYRQYEAEKRGERYSLRQFARDSKRSEEKLRAQIRWTTQLPADVQEAVGQGLIKYAISNELVRIYLWAAENLEDEAERDQYFSAFVLTAINKEWTAGTFTRYVTDAINKRLRDIESKKQGEFDLEAMMYASCEQANRKASVKRELSRNTEHQLRSMCSMVKAWHHFIVSGRLQPRNSPVLAGAVRRQIEVLCGVLRSLLLAAQWLAKPDVYQELMALTEELPKVMQELDALFPDSTTPYETHVVASGA